jgi:hypothetical protein
MQDQNPQQPPKFIPPDVGPPEQAQPDQILDPSNRQDFPEDFNRPKAGFWEWLMKNNLLIIASVMITALIIVAGLWFLRNKNNSSPESANVLLSIKGPDSMASGNEGEYRFIYTNAESSDLNNITLEVFFPSNFKFASSEPEPSSGNGQRYNLPVLRQGQSAEVKIKGKVIGATGETKEMRARLNFGLADYGSQLHYHPAGAGIGNGNHRPDRRDERPEQYFYGQLQEHFRQGIRRLSN